MAGVVAIHGSNGLAAMWPTYAEELGYRVLHVNAYNNDILKELKGCSAFLWNVDQDTPNDIVFGRSILLAAQQSGLRVFPNHATVWHFDDKVAQKYLLESVGAPLVQTWVFFDRPTAESFVKSAPYPLVFKLRSGAAAQNVRLLRTPKEAMRVVRAMFGTGIRANPVGAGLRRAMERARQHRDDGASMLGRGQRAAYGLLRRIVAPVRERGYVLFQRFMPGNSCDIRVTVIGDRAFVYTRGVRPNDFRASGSGLNTYLTQDEIPLDVINAAFGVVKRLGAQALALDFVRDMSSGHAHLLEISYTFVPRYIELCPGYLTSSLQWHAGSFHPSRLILEDLLTDSTLITTAS